jgi:hypothetical protein
MLSGHGGHKLGHKDICEDLKWPGTLYGPAGVPNAIGCKVEEILSIY